VCQHRMRTGPPNLNCSPDHARFGRRRPRCRFSTRGSSRPGGTVMTSASGFAVARFSKSSQEAEYSARWATARATYLPLQPQHNHDVRPIQRCAISWNTVGPKRHLRLLGTRVGGSPTSTWAPPSEAEGVARCDREARCRRRWRTQPSIRPLRSFDGQRSMQRRVGVLRPIAALMVRASGPSPPAAAVARWEVWIGPADRLHRVQGRAVLSNQRLPCVTERGEGHVDAHSAPRRSREFERGGGGFESSKEQIDRVRPAAQHVGLDGTGSGGT